jgi:hypothetical protein
MRYYVLVGALYCLFQLPAAAQVPVSPVGQSIEGTWIAQVADPTTGKISLFEVGDFSAEGSYTGANVNPTHTTHKGVWQRIGHLQFTLTVLFFTHDAQGVFNGITEARIYITLAEDLNSYDSIAERITMDKDGNVIAVTPGIRGHAVRMNVELPQHLPPL